MSRTKIVPSTTLKTVCVHKLQDLTCLRLYFWHWILNLEPRKVNLNFWFGDMTHAGAASHEKYPTAVAEMSNASKNFLRRYPIESEDKVEIKLQTHIAKLLLKTYLKSAQKRFKNIKILGTEVPFKYQLKSCPVLLEGTIDDYGKEDKDIVLLERKTATRIGDSYFKKLKADKQINAYCIGVSTSALAGRRPRHCYYDVIRKPSLQMHKKDTVETFLARLEADLIKREDWYFFHYKHDFGKQSVDAVMQDIEGLTLDLHLRYQRLKKKDLLNPFNWPRNCDKCFDYGTCSYYPLCDKMEQWWLYLNLFMPRAIRYDTEHEELSEKDSISPGFHAKLKLAPKSKTKTKKKKWKHTPKKEA